MSQGFLEFCRHFTCNLKRLWVIFSRGKNISHSRHSQQRNPVSVIVKQHTENINGFPLQHTVLCRLCFSLCWQCQQNLSVTGASLFCKVHWEEQVWMSGSAAMNTVMELALWENARVISLIWISAHKVLTCYFMLRLCKWNLCFPAAMQGILLQLSVLLNCITSFLTEKTALKTLKHCSFWCTCEKGIHRFQCDAGGKEKKKKTRTPCLVHSFSRMTPMCLGGKGVTCSSV